MSEAPLDTTTTAPDADAPRRSITALIAAAVLIAAVVAAVLLFGVARPPELAAIDEGTAPAAAVAWNRWEDDESCIHVAWPDGRVTTPYCATDGGEIVAWPADGIVLRAWGRGGETEVTIDAETGEVIERRAVDSQAAEQQPRPAAPVDNWVRSDHEDGVLTVTFETSGGVIWTVEAPDAYRITSGVRSPDGDWVAMVDSASRLLVVEADGSAEPRVWASDVDEWQVPMWQGTARD